MNARPASSSKRFKESLVSRLRKERRAHARTIRVVMAFLELDEVKEIDLCGNSGCPTCAAKKKLLTSARTIVSGRKL